jgi:hypothetical protein
MGTVEVAEKAAKSMDKQVVASKKSKTKRQRRKDLQHDSDKNKWLIQHPKIQSMDRREQIYIKDAGLNETKAEKRQAPIDPKLDLMSPEVKFGRLLAGTDQRKRHAAVKKLKAYLKARCDISEVIDGDSSGDENNSGGISELDLLKLWKALWYTLYMADKRPVQDELSKHICKLLWCVVGTEEEDECAGRAYLEMTETEERELEEEEDDEDVTLVEIVNTFKDEKDSDDDDEDSEEGDNEMEDEESDEIMEMDDREIPHCRGAHLVSLFVRTFFSTIRRDWGSMDKYRIDKFYALIRLMMHEIYEYMSVRSWDYGIVLLLNDAIFAETLKEPPNGLRYHLIDLCLEELAKVNAKAKIPLTEATFLDVLEPFFGLCQTGRHDDTVQARVTEKVIDNFLENYCVVSENALREDDDDDKDKDKGTSLIFKNVHVKTIAEFLFTLGSDPDTKDKYRKSLYDLHKKFMRRLKKIGKDVEILTDEDGNEIYDDNEGGNGDGVDDVTLNNIDESIQFLEAETNEDGDVDMLDDEPAKEEESVDKAKKESKKKKKKKRKSMDQESRPEPEITPITNDTVVNEKRKKKKKKSDSGEADVDEEVVITLTEQQDAKKKDRKSKKKLKEQKEEKASADSEKKEKKGTRRVSFGAKNRAKSHKASMKALRTTEPPSTKETVPEKGILRKIPRHGKNTSSVLSKKQRKKATSYF